MKTKYFEGVFKEAKIKGYNVKEEMVRDFFRDKALQTKVQSPRKIVEGSSAKKNSVTKPMPGKMLLYNYDAKTKDKLPYWDRFPVNFVVDVYNDGFLALNLHYLPPVYRVRLMDALYDTLNNKRFDESTKLSVNYKILKQASNLKYFRPCIKRYLYGHIRSNIVEIPPDEWDYCAFLPLARFVGKNQRSVWESSLKEIMKNG